MTTYPIRSRNGQPHSRATDEQAAQARNRVAVLNHMGWAIATISDAAGGAPSPTALSNILNGFQRPSRNAIRGINRAFDALTSRQHTWQKNRLAGRRPRTASQQKGARA